MSCVFLSGFFDAITSSLYFSCIKLLNQVTGKSKRYEKRRKMKPKFIVFVGHRLVFVTTHDGYQHFHRKLFHRLTFHSSLKKFIKKYFHRPGPGRLTEGSLYVFIVGPGLKHSRLPGNSLFLSNTHKKHSVEI